jgi:hypothetical protein
MYDGKGKQGTKRERNKDDEKKDDGKKAITYKEKRREKDY